MAFDQTTRNRLQRCVNDARRILEEEVTRQLQNDYGMDPNAGSVAELTSLRHINDAQRESARILRDTLAHYCASGDTDVRQGLNRIVREQAFTVLNRLAALRMAEARGLLVESVGNGFQAKGFQLYARLAGTGVGETGDAYRTYLFSVFDELSQDLPGLFDRYSPQGRLFPREAALLQILNLINDGDIAPLWSQDETIGWIYQYFNSKEERKAMRDASQAPRNSRELAVRNQFFTPRYVVEFLVDNTLGRLWFNATGGDTHLRERCQYLLMKPDEVPQAATKLRDPRTLKLLDPACGSMHFGLYAFDLFAEIYREAWAWEQQHGPGSLDVSTQPQAALTPLSQTYENEVAFLRDVPRLIVEYNIYGVDIDPRAAQIASLALWLRAQRAWHDNGVKAKDRPLIGCGHVVAAIAPPAEIELRQRFVANLDERDAGLFEKTLQLLKGLPELGLLLQVERELPQLIRQAYVGKGTGLFAMEEQENWQKAEARLRCALTEFAQATKSSYQGRLFAQDALQGLRLIDLCREVFDVVVMNPPFGEASAGSKGYVKKEYKSSFQDIFQVFVERGFQLLRNSGWLGVLSARTGFFMGDSEAWRRTIVFKNELQTFSDLGLGVLDDAWVEAAAYIMRKGHREGSRILASRHLSSRENKGQSLLLFVHNNNSGLKTKDSFEIPQAAIEKTPSNTLPYWAPETFIDRFRETDSLESCFAQVRQGLATAEDFRFVRLAWEVSPAEIGAKKRWQRFSKGGEYSPPFDDIHLLVDWGSDGEQLKSSICNKYPYLNGNWSFVIKNCNLYFKPGATYTVRTASAFAAKILPAGCIFSHNAQSWFIEDERTLLKSVVYFLCRVPQAFIELAVGGGDIAESGTAARRYTTKAINSIPAAVVSDLEYSNLDADLRSILRPVALELSQDETSNFYTGFDPGDCLNLSDLASSIQKTHRNLKLEALLATHRIDQEVSRLWGLSDEEIAFVAREIGCHPCEYDAKPDISGLQELLEKSIEELVAVAIEIYGAQRWATKKSYFVDRKIELLCHILQCSPEWICEANIYHDSFSLAEDLVSHCVGIAFGRWSLGEVDSSDVDGFLSTPFKELPSLPPAARRDGAIESILVGDPLDSRSISRKIESALSSLWPENANIESDIHNALGTDLDTYLKKKFFQTHLSKYGKSRRSAPIYWPLSTASGSYTLWVYYHGLSGQTLYSAINDFVEPKLKEVSTHVVSLRSKGTSRSREDEKQFESLQELERELVELLDNMRQLAPGYKPSHNDGVEISASPLWPLIRYKPWQKVLKDTWVKLEKGDYDWAHLAMNYWPERVREKCKTDKSLAIAHGLEDLYIEPEAKPKKARGKKAGGDE